MEILFTRRSRNKAKGGNARRLKKIVAQTLEMEAVSNRSVSILLTDDREIHELNRTWRAQDKPTDVLAFAYDESLVGALRVPKQLLPLGDLVISVETAKRQSQSRSVGLDAELELLAVHGTLHLLGYDHAQTDEARRMKNRTRAIRNAIRKRLSV
jgi:probable rRNA maturation factor